MGTKASEGEIRSEQVPKLLHFIWMGKSVPEEYLKNIHLFTSKFRDQGYKAVLWTDDARHYARAVRTSSIYSETGIPGLEVKNIAHIVEQAIHDYRGEKVGGDCDKGQVFSAIVDLERVGLHNYAMVSDLLRYEVLRQQGGVYLDVDNKFCLVDGAIEGRAVSLSGFKVYGGFNRWGYSGGNDVLASSPGHTVVSRMVANVLENYVRSAGNRVLDNPFVEPRVIQSYQPFFNYNDLRRSPTLPHYSTDIWSENGGVKNLARVCLTMKMSGPAELGQTIGRFLGGGGKKEDLMLQVPYTELFAVDEGDVNRTLSIDGVGVRHSSAFSWVKSGHQGAFDDMALPSSREDRSNKSLGLKESSAAAMATATPSPPFLFPLSIYKRVGLFYGGGGVMASEDGQGVFSDSGGASSHQPQRSTLKEGVAVAEELSSPEYVFVGSQQRVGGAGSEQGCCARLCQSATSFVRRICGRVSGSAEVVDSSVQVR